MASPLQTGKKSVDMSAPVVRVSRIRRDPPPPPAKEVTAGEIKEREARTIIIGTIIFAAALVVVLIGFSNVSGWSPSEYNVHIEGGL